MGENSVMSEPRSFCRRSWPPSMASRIWSSLTRAPERAGALAGSSAAATCAARQSRKDLGTVVKWPWQSMIMLGTSDARVDEQLAHRHAARRQALLERGG